MDITLNEALEDYARQRFERYAKSTRDGHEGFLERWRKWVTAELGPYCLLLDIEDRMMTRYYSRFRPPNRSANSFNNYRQYGKQFFDYCRGEGWITVDPMRHIDPLTPPQIQRLQLSAGELRRGVEMLTEPRDKVGIMVGASTALRAGDCMALQVGSVDLEGDRLFAYIQKTKKSIELPVTADLHNALITWFKHYAAATGIDDWTKLPNDWTLIPSAHYTAHNPWKPELGGIVRYNVTSTYSHPEFIVHEMLRKLGHKTKGEGFHTLRRSAGRILHDVAVQMGYPDALRLVQALYDHKDIQTTQRYLGLTPEKLRLRDLMKGQDILGKAIEMDNGEVEITRPAAKTNRFGVVKPDDDDGLAGVAAVRR